MVTASTNDGMINATEGDISDQWPSCHHRARQHRRDCWGVEGMHRL